jgi:thiamine transport system ATP-binding protein
MPDAGTVCWDGEDLSGVPTHKRHFGLMFQDHALFAHSDVSANVAFGLRMQGREKKDVSARVTELLELVGLAGFDHRAIDELSGGEQQRVALARALAPEPRLLMLDEPLGALDRALRDRLVNDLARLFDELGTTVLYVTHDHDEALAIADRVAIMAYGKIVQEGSPSEVWGTPANEFVADFLGTAGMLDGADLGLDEGPVAIRRLGRKSIGTKP